MLRVSAGHLWWKEKTQCDGGVSTVYFSQNLQYRMNMSPWHISIIVKVLRLLHSCFLSVLHIALSLATTENTSVHDKQYIHPSIMALTFHYFVLVASKLDGPVLLDKMINELELTEQVTEKFT